jgi:hypothetical protein
MMETGTAPHPSEEMPEEVPSLPPDGSDGTDQGEGTEGDLQQEESPGESAEGVGE